jgi:periplasmic protein TonB
MNSPMMTMNTTALIDFNSFIKKMLALCLGVVMTMMLFYMMYLLIKNDALPEETSGTPVIPNVNLTIPKVIATRPDEVEFVKPVEHKLPPRIVEPNNIDIDTKPGLPTFERFIPPEPKNPVIIANTQSLPMVKFAPAYPSVATAKGIEGFVDVVFDVTETGATENIQIVYAEPAKIFNSAVLKAVARWKYKPKMEEGIPMKMYGLRERIRFNMEK